MAIKDRTTLKGYFVRNALITEEQFADFIDSTILKSGDSKIGAPLKLESPGTSGQEMIQLYGSAGDEALWSLSLESASKKQGFTIRSAGVDRLFIDESTGNVGIGTDDPQTLLDVDGDLQIQGTAAVGGLELRSEMTDHPAENGAFYRLGNEVYATVDDAFHIHINDGNFDFDFGKRYLGGNLKKNVGILKTQALQLGEKWLLSGVGDVYAENGDFKWLRLCGVDEYTASPYYGGLAAYKLFSTKGLQVPSDSRLKRDIQNLEGCLEEICKLQGVGFHWKDIDDAPRQSGLVAQHVEKVYPDLVQPGPDGEKTLDYMGLIAPMIEAIKELKQEVVQLREEVNALKGA